MGCIYCAYLYIYIFAIFLSLLLLGVANSNKKSFEKNKKKQKQFLDEYFVSSRTGMETTSPVLETQLFNDNVCHGKCW
jgi:hypothetical protein